MSWVVLILIGIVWLIVKAAEGVSSARTGIKKHQDFSEERSKKFQNRKIDFSKDLFERNRDIISRFENKLSADSHSGYSGRHSYQNYHIENETRDSINEICLAENEPSLRPGRTYLSSWQRTASSDWLALSKRIEKLFTERQQFLKDLETNISEASTRLGQLKEEKADPSKVTKIDKRLGRGALFVDILDGVLTPNQTTWVEKEHELINHNGKARHVPLFPTETKHASIEGLNRGIDEYNKELDADVLVSEKNKKYFTDLLAGYKSAKKDDVVERLNLILSNISLPASVPKTWDLDFDTEQAIAVVEIGLPDVVHQPVYKNVQMKASTAKKPLNQKEAKEFIPKIHPAIVLRIAYEVFRNDVCDVLKLLVVNGWVEFDDPTTGNKTRTYTASLVAEKEQIVGLNLKHLEPLSAFINLKGKTAGKLIDIIPIVPIMSLDKKDKRFIETKEVLNKLGTETNLASMDWQDFESLIAELFEKEFAQEGAEIKVTQASRDRGVDAVIFNPDPIKGGKYIVQAKRYANTVDVSAVRDLCAVVNKEGASKGILVTTSTYGSDAYAFAQNEPITLINGAELLGLLKKHGYTFRINLDEARKLNAAMQQQNHEGSRAR